MGGGEEKKRLPIVLYSKLGGSEGELGQTQYYMGGTLISGTFLS